MLHVRLSRSRRETLRNFPSFHPGPQRFTLVVILLIGIFAGLATSQESVATAPSFAVDANYPGGNIVVERIEGDTVQLRPDLRDTDGWWFYWSFRVRGAQGRSLTFTFSGRNPIGVRGPAVSVDGGKSWSWLGAEVVKDGSFQYSFAADAQEVRFCFGIPYLEENLKEFLSMYKDNPGLSVQELCRTPQGRSVERLHVGRLDGRALHRVLLTARHHACETMGDYVMEGILESVLADNDDGCWFRRNVEILAIPFVDKDGVEQGDQGKNRVPRDHNRDYIGQSVHASVAALRTFVPNWSDGRLVAAFDLHCPYMSGPNNEVIYIVGSSDESMWRQQREFGRLLETI
ncbi:MAG: M14 family zinc carboxypeptidase, partial [Solirubrobacterales bacterium]